MKSLPNVEPTPEQLRVVAANRTGPLIIRGAAGSGKTTTAILRLKAMLSFYSNRVRRIPSLNHVNALVLTFNRTLRGYVEALAREGLGEYDEVNLRIETFAGWAMEMLNRPSVIDDNRRRELYAGLGSGIELPSEFLIDEIEYIQGRFLPEDIEVYLEATRDGRGISPRVERDRRERILAEVIEPYFNFKRDRNLYDWFDLAALLTTTEADKTYQVVVADEVQDFTANQIRAINNHLSDDSSFTLVIDQAQKIYAHHFTWKDVGLQVRPENTVRLENNYRNTREIARFARPLVEGIDHTSDATIPDFDSCVRDGSVPNVLVGNYSDQMQFSIDMLENEISLEDESVAFLHPLGGNWFNYTVGKLEEAGIPFVRLTRRGHWPDGPENVALSTMYSAKGLEFDHVFILGLNAEVTKKWKDEEDVRLIMQRRLLAMSVGRARVTVTIGYKPSDPSKLIDYLDPDTYDQVDI